MHGGYEAIVLWCSAFSYKVNLITLGIVRT